MQAFMYGHAGIVQQLLESEMQLSQVTSANSRDALGQAALHYAARWGYPEVRLCCMVKFAAVVTSNHRLNS